MGFLIFFGVVLILAWFGLVWGLNALIRNVVLQSPDKPSHPLGPTAFGLPIAQERVLLGSARVWKFERPGSNRIVHFFHGNGQHPMNALWHISEIYKTCNCTVSVFAWMHLGHSEEATTRALAAYVETFTSHQTHWLFGMSLGTNAAMRAAYLLERHVIHGIILENPFTSFDDFMPSLLRIAVKNRILPVENWNSLELARKTTVPVLVLSSERDEVVPLWQHQAIFDALYGTPREFVLLAGASHGDALSHPLHLPALVKFIEKTE